MSEEAWFLLAGAITIVLVVVWFELVIWVVFGPHKSKHMKKEKGGIDSRELMGYILFGLVALMTIVGWSGC